MESTFFDNPTMHDNDNYTNYGLRSNMSHPHNPALIPFENDIYYMVRNTEFRNVRNDFQDKLKKDISEIHSSKNLFVFAGKSTKLYQTFM